MASSHSPELLTPAGSESAFKAAIIAGADAIYFGVEQFNARRRAENISLEKLPELISIASAHGVKTYLTLNILLYDDEIAEALRVVDAAIKAGISAVIIQDLGILSVLRQQFPSLEIHASTQMTTHNLSQCRFLLSEGVSQVNLSRELSLLEIKPLAAFLSSNGIRPEIFVHGAFCISYSGQCYLSEHLYDEPGNRGQCVQPCRRKYVTLLETNNSSEGSNNSTKSHKSKPFAPFNLKDNCLYPDISTLLEAVPNASLKIEGRIKSAQYVWAVTSAWREKLDSLNKCSALDKFCALDKYRELDKYGGLEKRSELDKSCAPEKLTKSMNRGLTDGYFVGQISGSMFGSGSKDESVEKKGTVLKYTASTGVLDVRLNSESRIENGYAVNAPDKTTKTGNTFNALKKGDSLIITSDNAFVCTATVKATHAFGAKNAFGAKSTFGAGNAFVAQGTVEKTDCAVTIQITGKLNGRIKPGNTVMRKPELISDEELARLTDKLGVPQKDNLIPLRVLVSGKIGENLRAVFAIPPSVAPQNSNQLQNSNQVEILSTSVLQPAQNRSLNQETLTEKFSRLGGTDFCFDSLDCKQLDSGLFLPLTELNDMRRRAVEQLSKGLSDSRSRTEDSLVPANKLLPADKLPPADKLAPASVFAPQKQLVLCAGISAATELLGKGKLPVLEIPLFKADDAQTEYSQFLVDNPEVIPLFQPVLFESDLDMAIKHLESISGANNTLKRPIWCENIGLALEASERGFPVIIGQQLNVTNSYTVSDLCHRLNVCAIVPSLELSAEKLWSLKSDVPILYPLTENRLLMQSRQCLVRNIPVQGKLCSKTETDRDCIFTCSRCSAISPCNETQFNSGNQGKNGNRLQVIKRPGFYSGVFTEFDARKKSDYAELKKAVSIWFTDNRFVEVN